MRLRRNEAEIMNVLWESKNPLTAAEIIESTPNRTFHEDSIFRIMRRLIKKGAVTLELYKLTAGKHAGAYKPIISSEDYAMSVIDDIGNLGIKVDTLALSERLKNAGEERQNGD